MIKSIVFYLALFFIAESGHAQVSFTLDSTTKFQNITRDGDAAVVCLVC